MRRLAFLVVALAFLSASAGACRSGSTSLTLGAEAPNFELPGVDGKTHKLTDFAASQVLAVVFTCNHCPDSQLYERRIQKLHEDYRDKGVSVIAINPNSSDAIPAGALRYSDVGDGLVDMKERARHRKLEYPYLYDGDKQSVSKAFKVVATPQIYIFDRDRKLRYQGRIDDNVQELSVKSHHARTAIDALLGGRTVQTSQTAAAGCPPVWRDAAPARQQTQAAVVEPISVTPAGPELLKKVRANDTGKLMLVNFWATWCGPCAVEFPDLVMTHRMYKDRPFQLVTISENSPAEEAAVLAFLKRQQAGGRHLLFASDRLYDLQAAFDPAMPAPVPFTLVIAPNGDVVYQELGSLDTLKMRRAVLANLPDDPAHPGMQAHWAME